MAAITITPLLESKPSISTSRALSVCSRSSWPPTMLVPRVLPSASSSSMKMMHGAFGFGLLEHVANAGRADADEHFDEVGARQAEERHARLAGDGLGQQRFAGARRADEQHALGNAAAEHLIFFGRLEKLDDFAQLFDGFVDAGHVFERDVDIFLGVHLAAAAAEGHRRAGAAQPADHEDEHAARTGRSAPASAHSPSRRPGLVGVRRTEYRASSSSSVQQFVRRICAVNVGVERDLLAVMSAARVGCVLRSVRLRRTAAGEDFAIHFAGNFESADLMSFGS